MQRLLVIQQRVLAGEQEDVRVCLDHRAQRRLRAVDAEAPGFDQPLLAHARQCGHRTLGSFSEALLPRHAEVFFVVRRQVMDEDHVQLRYAEPIQAVLHRPPRAVGRVVVAVMERRRVLPHHVLQLTGGGRQQATDLGRQRVLTRGMVVKMVAVAALAQPEPVPR
ncbi:hypothetical protein D3C71_1390430 [compost metagenome]